MVDRDDDLDRPGDRGASRRKGPIVNRSGPSEVSRARQKMSDQRGRPVPGKKAGPAGVSRGTVVRMDRSKGYGFIVDSAGEQRFFHKTAVLGGGFDGLEEQQAVDFEPYSDERGARAQKVRPAGATIREESSPRPPKPAPPKPASKAPSWKSDLSPFRSGFGTPSNRKRPKI